MRTSRDWGRGQILNMTALNPQIPRYYEREVAHRSYTPAHILAAVAPEVLMLQPPVAGLRDAHQILLPVLMDVPIRVRKGTAVKARSKKKDSPHRKIDAVVSLLCITKVVDDCAVIEWQSTVWDVPSETPYVLFWEALFGSLL